jgi:two-component system LytT family response regulator
MNIVPFYTNNPARQQQFTGNILLLPTAAETLCIAIDSIIRIEASSNYSKVYCKNKTFPIVVAKVLRWFEEKLPAQFFARVHRTHPVNRNYMVSIRNNNIQLQSGIWIAVSKRKKKKVFSGFNSIGVK